MPKVDKIINDEKARGEHGERFQAELGAMVRRNKLQTVVETGYGISTIYILHAMEHGLDMERARLYSVDPAPWYDKVITSPHGELIRKRSYDALPDLYRRTGPWDLFLHDSNHDIRCMTYELRFAYACLKTGGIIACDDCGWGGHDAWEKFSKERNLEVNKCGSVLYAVKNSPEVLSAADTNNHHQNCLEFASAEECAWLAAGNKNSECFKDCA